MSDSWRSSSGSGVDWSRTPFRDVELIGRGGMGVVFRGFDVRVGRAVALKLQHRGTQAARARFWREGQLAAALQHPNVVQIHEICMIPQGDVLVCELVDEAEPLDQAWRTLDTLGRVRLLRDAAAGVAAAHALGIVHRDLKPDNVLVDGAGRARVSDFGVAYSGELDRLTQTGAMVGTPSFMAPEQLTGKTRPTAACDVWSLGVLLYLALTDQLPFSGRTILELAAQVATGASDSNLRAVTSAPAPLRELVLRCLAKAPEDRPEHAGLVRDALQAWLDDPVAGRRRSGLLPWVALGTLSVLGVVGAGVFASRDSEPVASASPSATPVEVAPQRVTSARAQALTKQLEDPQELLAYAAAVALCREFPEDPAVPRALALRERLRGRPLLTLRSSSDFPRGRLLPDQGPALVWAAGDGRLRRWSPAGEQEVRLPRIGRSRLWFGPEGRVLFHSSWREPAPGLFEATWSEEPRWVLDPATDTATVTAACGLGEGRLGVGGVGELRVLSASGETLARVEFPGEVAHDLRPFAGGLLCVTIKGGGGVGSSLIRLFGLDLNPTRAPIGLPGSDVRLALRPGDRRILVVNSYFSKLTLADAESGALSDVFTPSVDGGRTGSMTVAAWTEDGASALVLAKGKTTGTTLACWSMQPGVGRLWEHDLPPSRQGSFAGVGPDFMVLGTKGRIQVYAISPEKP